MNLSDADRARLELARRAFKAAEPSAAEVQTGVRRARLWLGRPKRRRPSWFSKGLVFVVLALGSLAYAKPQALSDLVEKSFTAPRRSASHAAGSALAAAQPERQRATAVSPPLPPSLHGPAVVTPSQGVAATNAAAAAAASGSSAAVPRRVPIKKAVVSANVDEDAPGIAPAPAQAPAEPAAEAVSDWGRVGQALAHGDESSALTALNQLAKSDDPRTRDKADLGRAQLFMAHGNREQACALAQRLTQRSAGSRIERQALALLKSCSR